MNKCRACDLLCRLCVLQGVSSLLITRGGEQLGAHQTHNLGYAGSSPVPAIQVAKAIEEICKPCQGGNAAALAYFL